MFSLFFFFWFFFVKLCSLYYHLKIAHKCFVFFWFSLSNLVLCIIIWRFLFSLFFFFGFFFVKLCSLYYHLKIAHRRGRLLSFPLKDHFLKPPLHFRAEKREKIAFISCYWKDDNEFCILNFEFWKDEFWILKRWILNFEKMAMWMNFAPGNSGLVGFIFLS